MKSINTKYGGYLFRSRLEARYAVLFDHLKLQWEYEAEDFVLGTHLGRYLPDFKVTLPGRYDFFIEVKGKAPTDLERSKIACLCDIEIAYGAILYGTPDFNWSGAIFVHKEGCTHDDGFGDFLEHLEISEQRWNAAVEATRSARFEFGETPKRRLGECHG